MLRSNVSFECAAPARRSIPALTGVALSSALAAAIVVGATVQLDQSNIGPQPGAPAGPTAIAPAPLRELFDPRPQLGAEARQRWQTVPLASAMTFSAAVRVAAVAGPEPAKSLPAVAAPAPAMIELSRGVEAALLPPPRPSRVAALEAVASEPRVASRPASSRARTAAAPSGEGDTRNFLEKLFGVPASGGTTYAALDGGALPAPPAAKIAPTPAPAVSAGGGTAIYDISARTLTLPGGERLEAHSGLGDKIDDPRFVHVRMRGATPPGTYDLTEREALFHGVRAIRLNPVGGSGAVHGRAGLLAHTYMLGPNGQSNGCVSLLDYDRFLQAFLRGEVRRLVVVAGSRGNGPFEFLNRRFGGGERRPAENGRDA